MTARFMRSGNGPLSLWMVELLEVGATDRVLEVGFGPGVALSALLERVPQGSVAGVEASELMVRDARRHFAAAVAAGRLDLRRGDAASLPFEDGSFDAVCGAHVLYFWPDPIATIRELGRVLRPGGRLALAFQEHDRMPPHAASGLSGAGARLYERGQVEDLVRDAGLEDVRLETRMTSDGPAELCVVAVKPSPAARP
jgi:ubiquinone/menaquinone biosynthesis C-methylase UbiE